MFKGVDFFSGGRGMGDLVWVRNFFAKTSGEGIFFRAHNSKRFFSSIIQQEVFLFSAGYFFAIYFFLKSPIPATKVKWLTPKLK